MMSASVRPVRDASRVVAMPNLVTDRGARENLFAALAHPVPDGLDATRLRDIRRLTGGGSYDSFRIRVDTRARAEDLVLRRQPLTGPLEPYDIGREWALMPALARHGVPVANPRLYCDDPGVIGAPFMVCDFVDGDAPDYRDIGSFPQWQDEKSRAQMAEEFIRRLAAIQRVPWREEELDRVIPGADPSAAVLVDEKMAAIRARTRDKWPLPLGLTDAALWLQSKSSDFPCPDPVLTHGDYRLGNFIWRDLEVICILDWELARIGDPMADLGYACHPMMRTTHPELMAMLMPLDCLLAYYERFSGRAVDMPRLHYYMILALFSQFVSLVLAILVAVQSGTNWRNGPAYLRFARQTIELVRAIEDFEDGHHVL